MEQIIQKLGTVYDECVKKSVVLAEKERELVLKEESLELKGKDISSLIEDLKIREAKVKEVEQPLDLLNLIKQSRGKLALERDDLQTKENAYKAYETKAKKDLANERGLLNNDRQLVDKELELLRKDRKALEKEKQEYKDNFLKELSKKVG